jgi:signal transduction histidine kinase
VKASALNKEQNIEIKIAENLEITADYNMMHTVLRNLLQNAIKFTGNKGWIKISAQHAKKEVTIAVEDNGTGIPAENLKKLFRMDIKFSSPGTNKETGTGLGLLLCKEFVEKHGGRIGVKSREGEGSRFYFSIPASAD